MDHDLGSVVSLDADHFEEVPCPLGTEVEHLAVVITSSAAATVAFSAA